MSGRAAELAATVRDDYIDRTIATVRNHRDADNCWPQWANVFADEIIRLRGVASELAALAAKKEPAGTWARITELQAINSQMTRHRDEQAARAEAAEAELALQTERADTNLDQGLQEYERRKAAEAEIEATLRRVLDEKAENTRLRAIEEAAGKYVEAEQADDEAMGRLLGKDTDEHRDEQKSTRREADARFDALRAALAAATTPDAIVAYEFDSEGRAYSRHANGEVWPTGYTARSFAGKSDVTPGRFREIAATTPNPQDDLRATIAKIATGSLHMPLADGEGDEITVHGWAPSHPMGCAICAAFDAALKEDT
jgi:hypothetical protein